MQSEKASKSDGLNVKVAGDITVQVNKKQYTLVSVELEVISIAETESSSLAFGTSAPTMEAEM